MGGTKIEGVALDDAGSAVVRLRAATPSGSYEAIVETVADLVAQVDAAAAAKGPVLDTVGVGHPGVVSPATGVVKNANSTALIGKPLHLDLTERLDRPVVLRNDADCFVLSESTDGAAAGASSVFGVIIGTGVGGGVVVRGSLVEGPNAIAGEWGHNPLPWPADGELPGPPCYCGKRGCIETWLSGPGLAADHLRATGASVEPPELLSLAGEGSPDAAASVDRYIDRLARSLATDHQRPRPRGDRPRGRAVQRVGALRGGPPGVGSVRLLGPGQHQTRPQPPRRLERRQRRRHAGE